MSDSMDHYDDLWGQPEAQAWRKRANEELLPMLEDSGVVATLFTGKPDAKQAVEMGFALLLDKPIIVVAPPGQQVPAHLMKVADEVIIGHLTNPKTAKRIAEAMDRVLGKEEES